MSTTAPTPVHRKIAQYLSLVKFSHTVFALPFAFIGFSYAILRTDHEFRWFKLVCMLLCMVFARSAAMGFNRWLDRNFDKLNPRTAQREIPAGVISPTHALWFVVVNCVLFVITTAFINLTCLALSPIALFVILFYSYTKRFTALCHLVLGVGTGLSPIAAYLTVTGSFALVPVLFSLTVFTWIAGFDIIYALQDETFDRNQQLYSLPSRLGGRRALMISNMLHTLTALLVIAAGIIAPFGWLYWIGVVIYVFFLVYQHLLVKPDDLSKVNIAFMNTNSLASILFSLFTISSLLFQ